MSKSPEDDAASQATERGKTRASQMLGETDGGQEQVEEIERGSVRETGTQCPQIIKATREQYKPIKSFKKTIGNSTGVPFSIKI